MNHEEKRYVGTKIITAWLEEKNGQAGYGVRYQDGYESWSPVEAFEEGYLLLPCNAGLPVFLERIFAEQAQLVDRIQKLADFLDTLDADTIEVIGITPLQIKLMETQLPAMMAYSMILTARLEAM